MNPLQSSSPQVQAVLDRSQGYLETILNAATGKDRSKLIEGTDLALNQESLHSGKVRDVYTCKKCVVLIATDRQSAFDRNLALVPFKGRVLTQTSVWWFEQTKHIVPNDVVDTPHPNAKIGLRCTVFPVEFIMRGYMTGSTSTSMWTHYNKGVRNYCGHSLPDGMVKNQKLETNLLTPTTKAEHDELISAEEIVKSGRMTQEQWDFCSKAAHELFAFGQKTAESRGLILVDTKYEFGVDSDGNIRLIDEIHTPDSSRYWIKDTYAARMAEGQPPENIDKEFLRLWFAKECDPYDMKKQLPDAPVELVQELSRRYIVLYELITGKEFQFPKNSSEDVKALGAKVTEFVTKYET
eukprot:m.40044 g.40044  ORF g.40044 m.40044 type:complete len:352 (-) comp9620_c0_seq1:4626-5681(-)